MNCPECQHPKSEVLETRGQRRRRKCLRCGCAYTTREIVVGRPQQPPAKVARKVLARIVPVQIREAGMSARQAIENLREARSLGLSIDFDDAEGLGLC